MWRYRNEGGGHDALTIGAFVKKEEEEEERRTRYNKIENKITNWCFTPSQPLRLYQGERGNHCEGCFSRQSICSILSMCT